MIILKEKEKLEEMGRALVSARSDNLPFRVAVNNPDHDSPAHAHLLDIKTGTEERGQFIIPVKAPRTPEEVKDFKGNLSRETKELLMNWMLKPHHKLPRFTNLEALWIMWSGNEKW